MTSIPLRIGPLGAPGYTVRRSGFRWLCEDGHLCRPGEAVAYCSIALVPVGRPQRATDPFRDEVNDLQIAFAPRVGGRLHKAAESSRGGFLDQHYFYHAWTPDFVLGHIETAPGERGSAADVAMEPRLLFLAGRRAVAHAEVRAGLHAGWFDRARAWWGEGDDRIGTVLSLGICEQAGVIRGERTAFLEISAAARGPAQAVLVPDDVLVPSARIAAEQIARTPAENQAIAADLARTFLAGPMVPTAEDWVLVGSLLSALQKSPLTDSYDVLTRTGLRRVPPADAAILSLNSEPATILRHRKLGYAVNFHWFRIAAAGPAVRAWVQSAFEPLKRTPQDIRRDYCDLLDAVRSRSEAKFLILNAMSSSGHEDVHSYAAFDRPLRDTLSSVRAKELNLMLHDLARERDVSIVDADAVAVDMGAAAHLPDGLHQSGPLQAELRQEILRILRVRGIRGFEAPPLS